MQNVSLNSVKDWLSYDIVRFKIELGVEEKFKCKNATKQTQHGDTPVQRIAMAIGQADILLHHTYSGIRTHTPSSQSSRILLILNGDNRLGLCDPSNLLLVLSAEERRGLLKLL